MEMFINIIGHLLLIVIAVIVTIPIYYIIKLDYEEIKYKSDPFMNTKFKKILKIILIIFFVLCIIFLWIATIIETIQFIIFIVRC